MKWRHQNQNGVFISSLFSNVIINIFLISSLLSLFNNIMNRKHCFSLHRNEKQILRSFLAATKRPNESDFSPFVAFLRWLQSIRIRNLLGEGIGDFHLKAISSTSPIDDILENRTPNIICVLTKCIVFDESEEDIHRYSFYHSEKTYRLWITHFSYYVTWSLMK
jgi:hypothetical protein